ncbi:MAG: glycosyltransferase family 2 protein [Alphaproteobacteria bacterium]|nr:glycosyltransferase family 2 protein [Alphaproteobacteria bacterium]
MTKLVIQVPCYNEEATLGVTLDDLPRAVPGVDSVEWLVVNDGSTDRTVEVARQHGADHIVDLGRNQGLARAFMTGLHASLRSGADIIVNTDADNQYRAADIEKLVKPILDGDADIVVGARPIDDIEHFSVLKKRLQRLGSWVVRMVSNTDIADAPSGFRAYSREAALRVNVFNNYTYTLETIIQAGQRGMEIVSVPVRTNADLRPSRLFSSIPSYVARSMMIIVRIFMIYKPMRFFFAFGSVPFCLGFLIGLRYLVLLIGGTERAHTPSLVLAAILLTMGFSLWILGLIADVMSVNRSLLEDIQLRGRRTELADEAADEEDAAR